jgi:hypothetical protein
MSIYGSTTTSKTSVEVANYLQAARSFVPELTVAPTRNLSALGPEYAGMCIDNYGRIACCQSVYQTGYAAGQIDPMYIMLGADMINRPNVEVKVGLTQPPILGILENPLRVSSSNLDSQGYASDPLVMTGMKGGTETRFTADSQSFNQAPKIMANPFAAAFAFAAANDTAAVQRFASADSLRGLSGMGGGQRPCGQTPLIASVAPEDEYSILGTNVKYTPVSPVIMLPGMATIDSAYNTMRLTNQLGGSGSISQSGQR